MWCFGSVVAYGSWSYGASNVWWNKKKYFFTTKPRYDDYCRICKKGPWHWTFYGLTWDWTSVLSNCTVGLFGRRRSSQVPAQPLNGSVWVPGYHSFPKWPIDRLHMTSSRPYGVPKQWNGGHVGVTRQSCGCWTFFSFKRFLLFYSIDTDNVS